MQEPSALGAHKETTVFGLGSKKRSASKPPWRIRLLTTGYLIEGSFQAEDYESAGEGVYALASNPGSDPGGLDAFQRPRLSHVRLRVTGNLATPEQSYSEWGMTVFDSVIAIVPDGEASLGAAQAAFEDYRHPLDVAVYAGPYLIRAQLLSDSSDRSRSPFSMSQLVPLAEAEIDCLLPGAQLVGHRVPWLLLNGNTLLHGCGVR